MNNEVLGLMASRIAAGLVQRDSLFDENPVADRAVRMARRIARQLEEPDTTTHTSTAPPMEHRSAEKLPAVCTCRIDDYDDRCQVHGSKL